MIMRVVTLLSRGIPKAAACLHMAIPWQIFQQRAIACKDAEELSGMPCRMCAGLNAEDSGSNQLYQ